MGLFRKNRGPETQSDKWTKTHPWGEQGSVDYWIEAMHRAYEMGEERAKHEADRLLELQGPQPPFDWADFPEWFRTLWIHHLAPWNDVKDFPHRMPY